MKQNIFEIISCIPNTVENIYFESIKCLIKKTISKILKPSSNKNFFANFIKYLPIVDYPNIENASLFFSFIIICNEKDFDEIEKLISKLQKTYSIKISGKNSFLFKISKFSNDKFYFSQCFLQAKEHAEVKKFIHYLKLTTSLIGKVKNEINQNIQITAENTFKNITSNLLIRKNEEEIFKNILILSKELKYVNDIPQVIINYEKQDSKNLTFLIILLRILKENTFPIEKLFLYKDTKLTFIHDNIQNAGILKKRYEKEANIFKVSIKKISFYREDLSLDIQKARIEVVSELKKIIGEFRDYNGGLIEKQKEAFNAFKKILSKKIWKPIEIDNFFYSIQPIIMQVVIKNSVLKALFVLINQIKEEKKVSIKIRSLKNYFLIVIRNNNAFQEKLTDFINTLNQSFNIASCILNHNNTLISGYIIKSNLEKHKFLYKAFLDVINEWKNHNNLSEKLDSDMKNLLSIFSNFSKPVKHKEKKQLRISFQNDPLTIDPRKSGDIFSSAIVFMLFSGLTEFKEDGLISLSLAKNLKISKDKKTYIFYLKDNIKWSDGKEITAYDFEESWKKILDPDFFSPCKYLFHSIINAEKASQGKISLEDVGIKSINEKILEVTLNHPSPYFLSITSFCSLFPIPKSMKKLKKISINKIVSNGPFLLKKWSKNKEIILEKNPFYWNAENITLNSIHISIVKDEKKNLQMFEKGEIDWAGSLISPLPNDTLNINNPLNINLKQQQPVGGTTFCFFNLNTFPFNNKNIRKAFGLAINRKKIIIKTNLSNDQIATRCIPPIVMNDKNLSLIKDNDIKRAKSFFKKGLQELKIKKDDLNIIFFCKNEELYKIQSEIIKKHWEECFNIHININYLASIDFFNELSKRNVQLSLDYWAVQYPDPMNILERFENKANAKNYSNWENEKYKTLIKKIKYSKDKEKRDKIIEEAEKLLIEDMPISPIYHHKYLTMIKPNVEGIFIGPLGEIHFNKAYFKYKDNFSKNLSFLLHNEK